MNKNFLAKLIFGLALVVAAVLWLLSITMPSIFGSFNLSWAVALVAGTLGTLFIIRGVFNKEIGVIKKYYVYIGAALLIVALFAVISAVAVPDNIVMPIIAVIVASALLLAMIATGGKKWDTGDNKVVGYKTYRERKAEEEKNKK